MPNTYEVVGTCDPDGTLRPYGTTAPKADPVVVAEDKLIATAAANQTYGAQLAYLKTYFDSLSDEKKVRSYLIDSFGQIFPLTNLETGTFSLFELYGSTNVNRVSFIFSSEKVYQITSASNYDLTSETDTGSISLYVRNALGQVDGTMDATNVTYGDNNVDAALTELNSNSVWEDISSEFTPGGLNPSSLVVFHKKGEIRIEFSAVVGSMTPGTWGTMTTIPSKYSILNNPRIYCTITNQYNDIPAPIHSAMVWYTSNDRGITVNVSGTVSNGRIGGTICLLIDE